MTDPMTRMRTLWKMYKLSEELMHSINHDIDMWDEAHGFGYDVPFDHDRYEEGHKCDEFQAIWKTYLDAKDAWLSYLDEFCKESARATEGQITYETARQLATSPRYEKRLNAIMCG